MSIKSFFYKTRLFEGGLFKNPTFSKKSSYRTRIQFRKYFIKERLHCVYVNIFQIKEF